MLNLLHILLACTTLLSTTGVWGSVHLCRGRLVDWQIFGAAQSCGMDADRGESDDDVTQLRRARSCEDVQVAAQLDIADHDEGPGTLLPSATAVCRATTAVGFAKTTWLPLIDPTVPTTRPPPLPHDRRRALLQRYTI